MKTLAAIIAALALSGCAHNQWVAPAVVGAVVGVAIHESAHQHRHQQPHVIYAPPAVFYQPRPQYCQQVPIIHPYGYVIGYRTICQ